MRPPAPHTTGMVRFAPYSNASTYPFASKFEVLRVPVHRPPCMHATRSCWGGGGRLPLLHDHVCALGRLTTDG